MCLVLVSDIASLHRRFSCSLFVSFFLVPWFPLMFLCELAVRSPFLISLVGGFCGKKKLIFRLLK